MSPAPLFRCSDPVHDQSNHRPLVPRAGSHRPLLPALTAALLLFGGGSSTALAADLSNPLSIDATPTVQALSLPALISDCFGITYEEGATSLVLDGDTLTVAHPQGELASTHLQNITRYAAPTTEFLTRGSLYAGSGAFGLAATINTPLCERHVYGTATRLTVPNAAYGSLETTVFLPRVTSARLQDISAHAQQEEVTARDTFQQIQNPSLDESSLFNELQPVPELPHSSAPDTFGGTCASYCPNTFRQKEQRCHVSLQICSLSALSLAGTTFATCSLSPVVCGAISAAALTLALAKCVDRHNLCLQRASDWHRRCYFDCDLGEVR